MNEHLISVDKTAKVLTIGKLSKNTKFVWIALHGYGQLANYMASKLKFLDSTEHFVICPEGLNKFYWHSNNEPVACWMTKDNRYGEISNFVSYLDKLYHHYCLHLNRDIRIVLFGFSQGCATIWRWLHASQPRFDVLINWAGWIPEDIRYFHLKEYFENKKMIVCYGDEDQYLSEEVVSSLRALIIENELSIEFEKFKGKHSIPENVLQEIIKQNITLDSKQE